jgi:oligopeptide transport system substrate-binding protein
MHFLWRNCLAALFVLILIAATAWALSFTSEPPADFTFVNDTEIKSVDPAISTGQPELRVIMALLEGLVNWDPKTLEPIPGIAQSWDISEDRLTFTFHLRPTAKWTDGTPVTAQDFLWQWRRILDPMTASEYAYQLWYIKNAERYTSKQISPGDRVEVELHRQAGDGLPFARGKVLRGKLEQVVEDDKRSLYLVEMNGARRCFQPVRPREVAGWTPSGQLLARLRTELGVKEIEPCKNVLLDFDEVGVKALDDRTLQVELRAPTPYFLFLAGYYPLFATNPRCIETYGYPDWTKPEHIVTNGAFKLASHKVRERIRLVKNEQYWNADNVQLNIVDVLPVESLSTSLNLYLTGRVQWIDKPPVTAVPELLKAHRADFDPRPGMIVYFYRLNCTRPPLDNPLVRKALALAINKQEIVDTVMHGGEVPALSIVPPGLGGYQPAVMGGYDPREARKLLADAGFPDGRGMPKIEILYNTEEAHQSIAELIQAQWKENLGIDVGLQNMEWNAYQDAQQNLHYQVSRAGWIGDYLDPNTFLDMWMTGNTNNQTGWSNKRYDKLISQAAAQVNPAARLETLRQAETILMGEMPIIPIYFYVTSNLVRPYVKGFYQNPLDVHPLDQIWIDQDEKQRFLAAGGRG